MRDSFRDNVCARACFFSREPGRRGIGCQVGIHLHWGEGGLFRFYPGIDFVRILTLFFYRNPWDVVSEIRGIAGGLGGGIDGQDFSAIAKCS